MPDTIANITPEEMESLTLREIHDRLDETPPRFDFRVYEAEALFTYLSESLDALASGEPGERNLARDIWNLQELIISVFPRAAVESYCAPLAPERRRHLTTFRNIVNAPEGVGEQPPHEGLRYVGGLFGQGRLNQTYSSRCPFYTPDGVFVTDTEEWMHRCGELTAKNMYLDACAAAHREERDRESQNVNDQVLQALRGLDAKILAAVREALQSRQAK